MKSLFASTLLLLACSGLVLAAPPDKNDEDEWKEGPKVEGGAKASVSAISEKMKFNDTGKDKKIQWDEVLKLHEKHDKEVAEARAEKKPEKALKKVDKEYKWLMQVAEFLLADADRDLVVTRDEYKGYVDLVLDDKEPKLELWHHEQFAKVWVDRHWASILETMDWDEVGSVSIEDMEGLYTWDIVSDDFYASDADKDERLNKAEYIKFKAHERLRGFWVDEVNHRIEYRDAHGNLISAGETATVKDGDKAPDTEGMKLGSSWMTRVSSGMTNGVPRWKTERSEIIFLNGDWSESATAKDRLQLAARDQFYFEDGKLWKRLNMFLVRKSNADAKPSDEGSSGGYSSGNRSSLGHLEKQEIEKIKLPAGTLECYRQEDSRGGKHFTYVIGGIWMHAARIDENGVRTLELLSIDK